MNIPLIVNISVLLVDELEYVIVIVVEVIEVNVAAVILLPLAKVTLPVFILNSKFVGAVRIKVTLAPAVKSLLDPSLITMFPKALYPEGNPEQVVIDKLGFVMVTVALALLINKELITNSIKLRYLFLKDRVVFFIIWGLNDELYFCLDAK
jgi:hypothetical protein